VNGHIERGLMGEINPTVVVGGQEKLNSPREVDGGREPKFAGKTSDKIELISASNGVKCSCEDTFKYDVVSGSDHWSGGGFMVNGG